MASNNINHNLTEEELREIATLAIAAKRKAYCPYSNFRVGACILVEKQPGLSTTVYQGSNVEVASTPVGTCAERCAIAPLVASIDRPDLPRVRALAVSTDIWPPASPCGMCRYVCAFSLITFILNCFFTFLFMTRDKNLLNANSHFETGK